VEVGDPRGYCLDAHVASAREFFELAARVQDAPRSDLDMRIFDVQAELAETSETKDPDRYKELSELPHRLWQLKTAGSDN
jgi:hypothetical protein